jgi:hypothetical protein
MTVTDPWPAVKKEKDRIGFIRTLNVYLLGQIPQAYL